MNKYLNEQMNKLPPHRRKKVHAMAKTLIHVQPVKDGIKHRDSDCPRGPKTQDAIVIHNRTQTMWGLKNKNNGNLSSDIYTSRRQARNTILYTLGQHTVVKLLVIEC